MNPTTRNTTQNSANQISIRTAVKSDLFETMCSQSNTPEKCQDFVDRLAEASLNITSKQ